MEFSVAKATDLAVITALIAGGTDGGNRTLDAAGLLDFVSDSGVSVYSNTLGVAQNIIASPQQWGVIQNLADSGRPIYQNLIGNFNQGGDLGATRTAGNLLGLNFRVDRNLTTGSGIGDDTIIVINPDAYTYYESPRLRLQTNVAFSGQIELAYYTYAAIATKIGAGAYLWKVA
jgi:hypothetical protein